MIRLGRNESGITHHPAVLKVAQEITNDTIRCYEITSEETNLVEMLSQYTDLPPDHLMLANGSTNFLRILANLMISGPEDEVVAIHPSYIDMIEFVEFEGGTMKYHYLQPDEYDHPKKEVFLEPLINDKTKIIYLCSPNNPISFLWSTEQVEFLCQKYPHCLVLVDQAYWEFQENPDQIIALAGKIYPNLAVTRTFSKGFALAGMRLGYLGARPELIATCKARYKGKEVNRLVRLLASTVLEHRDHYLTEIRNLNALKNWLIAELRKLNITTWESDTNFIAIYVGNALEDLVNYLASQQITIKNLEEAYQMKGFLRISIGFPPEIKAFLKAVQDFYQAREPQKIF